MLIKDATAIVGGVSTPNKMPGHAIGLPAMECNVGGKLRKIAGSICHGCYAMKNNYLWDNVQKAQYRRLAALDHPQWVEAMTVLCRRDKYFRWHDSGDIQSIKHLMNIFDVCEATPETKHWIPTKEKKKVNIVLRNRPKPKNLVIRLSDAMVDSEASGFSHTSGVTTDPKKATCPAYKNDGQCGNCRKCWNPRVKRVVYLKH